jgi:hypothetical protein
MPTDPTADADFHSLFRLALCRTSRIGFAAQMPCRIAWLNRTLMTFLILAQDDRAKGKDRIHNSTSPA